MVEVVTGAGKLRWEPDGFSHFSRVPHAAQPLARAGAVASGYTEKKSGRRQAPSPKEKPWR